MLVENLIIQRTHDQSVWRRAGAGWQRLSSHTCHVGTPSTEPTTDHYTVLDSYTVQGAKA